MPQEFPTRHSPGMPHPSFPGMPHLSFSRNFPPVILRAFSTRHSPGIPPLSFPPVVSGNPERKAMNPIDLAPRLTYAAMAPSYDDKTDTRRFVLVPGIPHPSCSKHSPPVIPGDSPTVIPVEFPHCHSRRLLAGIQKKEPRTRPTSPHASPSQSWPRPAMTRLIHDASSLSRAFPIRHAPRIPQPSCPGHSPPVIPGHSPPVIPAGC